MPAGYDIIGDVHGHGYTLRNLLETMGYHETAKGYCHPNRSAIFVGDLIDRGPYQEEVYRLVRTMCEAGTARCILGNHEINALAWATPTPDSDPDSRTERDWLRPHNESHTRQHKAFLEEFGEGSDKHREVLAWFETLPAWIEENEFRVVHACWHETTRLQMLEFVDSLGCFRPDGLLAALTRGTPAYEATEILLKGPEVRLPEHIEFYDHGGTRRHKARIKWWQPCLRTYRDAAIVSSDLVDALPVEPLPTFEYVYMEKKPVFFGHYWLQGPPMLQSPSAMCLDFGIAAHGVLTAYRWSGEEKLEPSHVVSVPCHSIDAISSPRVA
jgi:hypothetical protein